MLTAMPQPRPPTQERDIPPVRDRGDACPGALRLHPADDGALARVRIPAGLLTARAARSLAEASEGFGDAGVGITSRGNLQLRGLDESRADELASFLKDAGLLPAPRHDRVRNIVASPLSGLDGRGEADVLPWTTELDELLCRDGRATELSGRFLFAVDDGRGDVAALSPDVTLLALPRGYVRLRVGTEPAAVRVPARAAARSAWLAAETFLTAVRESGVRAWRVAELPPEHSRFAHRLTEVLNAAAVPARYEEPGEHEEPGGREEGAQNGCNTTGDSPDSPDSRSSPESPGMPRTPSPADAAPRPGAVGQLPDGTGRRCPGRAGSDRDGRLALCVAVPFGQLNAEALRLLADIAERDGTGWLRVTPWRSVILPGVPGARAGQLLGEAAAAGLVTGEDSPWLSVGACTGRPGCARSHRDVRADAAAQVAELPRPHGARAQLPVYWSGCERRCGHPHGAWVDVVAGEDGYTVTVRGTETVDEATADTVRRVRKATAHEDN